MHIDVQDLPIGGRRFAGTTAVRMEKADETVDVEVHRPVAFGLWAVRDGVKLRVRGWLSTTVRARCVRCLRDFPLDVRRDFELAYVAAPTLDAEGQVELDEEDLDIDYYRDDTIDLRHLLKEQLLLSLPMKLVCDPECEGLCPQCGVDRNVEECDCGPTVDPRLASLAKIRDRL